MPRVGTLLGHDGRPEERVQVIRKGEKTTRIKRPVDHGRAWALEDEQIDTALLVDDGGQLWEQYSRNPKHASYVDSAGEPVARLQVQRVYKNVVKVKVYLGEHQWSKVEDVPPSSVCFDGGTAAGWNPPTYLQDISETGTDDNDAARDEATTPATTGQRVSYIRVSSAEQNLARQREMIGPVDREFQDKISARSRADRAGLESCIDYLREHDQLYVSSIDRLARSLVDLRGIIDQITDKGASVHFIKENLAFSAESNDSRAQLMLGILGSFAEFERSIIRERQTEGIALAKKAGKYTGRRRALTPDDVEKARKRVEAGESKVAIAQDLGIGRATLYRALSNNDKD